MPGRAKLFGEPACRGALLLNPCHPCWWLAFPTSCTRASPPCREPMGPFAGQLLGLRSRTAAGQGVGVLLFQSWELGGFHTPVPNPRAIVTGPWNLLPPSSLALPTLAPSRLLACVPPRPSPSWVPAPAAFPASADSSPPRVPGGVASGGLRAVGPARGLQVHPKQTFSAFPTPELLVALVIGDVCHPRTSPDSFPFQNWPESHLARRVCSCPWCL